MSSRWRSTISSGTLSRLVIGVTPGDWYSQALYQPTGVHDSVVAGSAGRGDRPERGCRRPARSRRGRNGRAANRRGAEALPGGRDLSSTDDQRHRGGRYRPGVGEVGALRLGGRRDQVAVDYPSAADATAHRDDFLDLGAGLSVYDNEQWRSEATRYHPLLGAVHDRRVCGDGRGRPERAERVLLGLVQRKRERAVLRAIGVVPRQEQAVVIAHAGLLGSVGRCSRWARGRGSDVLWSLGSPVYYGIKIDWGVLELPYEPGAVVFVLVVAAAAYPVIHSRRLETAEVLRAS